ncbi:hypothetical protein AQUCO_01800166v1 [Aquilegia coerulea]|uniref:Terpene synthase N-terminal domain-containing protein n=1 Tax=Aquilegia coerulea TaxID=218851 RepID=A0A2G5DK78_AQUCA|nr:hypothetical protein AQUCO_01800166v1 [Aquilegia coerulea]
MNLRLAGNPPSSRSAMNPRLVGNLPSSGLAITPGLKNGATKCSNSTNASWDATPEVKQHFHPSVWDGHDFTSASTKDLIDERRLIDLKREVKDMFSLAAVDSFQELDLIDNIQRLGVAYSRMKLNTYYNGHTMMIILISLIKILARMNMRNCLMFLYDVFKKFKDEKGEFHANLASDVHTMLSLYEASYLSFRGEDIMDEAMNFSAKHLNSMLKYLSSPLALQVQHALTMSIQRSPERVYARYYISIYQQDISRNETLLEFAKLDYNFVQFLHQKEINELQSWWEHIDLRSKLQCDFRRRVVEAYAINNNVYFEPQFTQGRIHLAKQWTILA